MAPTERREHLVLCVDDEAPVLNSLGRALRLEPYQVVTTTLAAEALELVGRQNVAVLIVDQRMPGMQGTELLKAVRQRSPRTRCVVLTAVVEMDEVGQAANEGAIRRLIYKPWRDEELKTTIRELIEEYERSGDRERELRAIRELHLFRAALDGISLPIAILSADELTLLYSNAAFARRRRSDPGQLMGAPARRILPAIVCERARSMPHGGTSGLTIAQPDGSEVFHLQPLFHGGTYLGVMISIEEGGGRRTTEPPSPMTIADTDGSGPLEGDGR